MMHDAPPVMALAKNFFFLPAIMEISESVYSVNYPRYQLISRCLLHSCCIFPQIPVYALCRIGDNYTLSWTILSIPH